MPRLKLSQRNTIDEAFISSGYVLDFNDRTYAEWFEEELNIEIDADRYRVNGDSKGKRLRTFIEIETRARVAKTLRALWHYRQENRPYHQLADDEPLRKRLFAIIETLEDGAPITTDAIDAFANSETLAELVQAIRRDADAGKPGAALDRLHTYCMKKFAFLLARRGIPPDTSKPLHSRVGEYVKVLEAERDLRPITKQILKNCIGIFQSYNDVRNNASFAHDNDIVSADEAKFIFETVMSMLRFVRAIEAEHFEASSHTIAGSDERMARAVNQ